MGTELTKILIGRYVGKLDKWYLKVVYFSRPFGFVTAITVIYEKYVGATKLN